MDSYALTLAAQGESGGAASARATAEVCRFFVGRALQLLREVVRDVFGGKTLPIPDAEAAALADQVAAAPMNPGSVRTPASSSASFNPFPLWPPPSRTRWRPCR